VNGVRRLNGWAGSSTRSTKPSSWPFSPSLAARARDVTLTPVRIFNRGICIRYPGKAGPEATYANLTGRKGTYRRCAVSGSASESGMVFEGNPVSFTPRITVRGLLDAVSARGFGHHLMLGYGDVIGPLSRFCRMTGIEGVFPDRS
jgi:L-fucose isomerase-like protein